MEDTTYDIGSAQRHGHRLIDALRHLGLGRFDHLGLLARLGIVGEGQGGGNTKRLCRLCGDALADRDDRV
jgi:hypothetical protein